MRRNPAFGKLVISGPQTGIRFPVWTTGAGCGFMANPRPRACCTKQCHPVEKVSHFSSGPVISWASPVPVGKVDLSSLRGR